MFEDLRLCYCYAIRTNNYPLASFAVCLCRPKNGHEWTAISSLHYTTRINLPLVQCAGHIGHRSRSRQIFGGAKDFCPDFLKLARKNFGPLFVRIFSHEDRFWNKKGFHVIQHTLGGAIFLNQSTLDAIFAVFSECLPRFSGVLPRFSQSLPRFPRILQIFRNFARIFTTLKLSGVRLQFRLPTPLISASKLSLQEASRFNLNLVLTTGFQKNFRS